jgi:hypothetical protein
MVHTFYYDAPGSPEMYRLVNEQIGGDQPEGLVVSVVTATEGGLRHLNVWHSREQWESYRDGRVRPAVADVLLRFGIPVPIEPPQEHPLELVDVGPTSLTSSDPDSSRLAPRKC